MWTSCSFKPPASARKNHFWTVTGSKVTLRSEFGIKSISKLRPWLCEGWRRRQIFKRGLLGDFSPGILKIQEQGVECCHFSRSCYIWGYGSGSSAWNSENWFIPRSAFMLTIKIICLFYNHESLQSSAPHLELKNSPVSNKNLMSPTLTIYLYFGRVCVIIRNLSCRSGFHLSH